VEKENTRDVRLAGGELERAAIRGRLLLLRDRRRDLVIGVQGSLRGGDRRLHADLAVEDRQVAPLLCGAVEGPARSRTSLS
jgi:hypothetical protein